MSQRLSFRRLEEREREQTAQLAERTAQLEAANRELEAFAYSVSHDLRAPLRSIEGFSQALLEEYEDRLDEGGCEYLRIIRSSCEDMARLIDDLLRLSRVSRGALVHEEVDLSRLARQAEVSLRRADPEREVEFVIQNGIIVQGDERLLRIALENLLGNAWKFTRKRDGARICLSAGEQDGQTVYCVRDNGVGFDMRYADKLFGAFQRLHSAREFEGTGIGLATVQRIIHRHGGRVWAHAVIDEGTAICFTLGTTSQEEINREMRVAARRPGRDEGA